MKYVAAMLLLAASSASPALADTSDRFSMGGWIVKFQPAIDEASQPVRISENFHLKRWKGPPIAGFSREGILCRE